MFKVIDSKRLSFIHAVFLFILSCTSLPLGKMMVVETSHSRPPDWLKRPPGETEEFVYSVGRRTDAAKMEDGLNDARMQAARKFIERYFGLRTSVEYKKVRRSFSTEYLDTLKGISKGEVLGTREKEIYWRRYEVGSSRGVNYLYDVAVLLEVKKGDIERAIQRHTDRMTAVIGKSMEDLSKGREGSVSGWLDILLKDLMALEGFAGNVEVEDAKSSIISRIEEMKAIGIYIEGDKAGSIFMKVLNELGGAGYKAIQLNIGPEEKAGILSRDRSVLKKIFVENKAYLYILGEIKVEPSGDMGGYMNLCRAVGRIALIDGFNGDGISSYKIEEKGVGASEISACKAASKKGEDRLIGEVIEMLGLIFKPLEKQKVLKDYIKKDEI